jgi:hypothetical protein
MTRLASTGWASALLGLAFTGAAAAQTAPADTTTPTPTDDTVNDDGVQDDGSLDKNVNTNPNTHTNTHNNTPGPNADVDVDTSAGVNADANGVDADANIDTTRTDGTSPADVDVNVRTPDPVVTSNADYVVPPTNTVIVDDDDDDGYNPLSGIGIALAAGGGAGGFTDDTMSNTTDVGGDWDVRLTLGTRSPIAFEGSYIGSAQNITALGLDDDAVLVGNGMQGALRVNATLDLPVQPFAFGGVAWRRYDLTNTDTNLSDVAGSDDVLEVPLGIGIAGRWGGFMLDARGEYRLSSDEDLIPSQNRVAENADMNRWGVKGTVGVEF